jgi:hypothetical protein
MRKANWPVSRLKSLSVGRFLSANRTPFLRYRLFDVLNVVKQRFGGKTNLARDLASLLHFPIRSLPASCSQVCLSVYIDGTAIYTFSLLN